MSTTQRASRSTPDYQAAVNDIIDRGVAEIRGAKSSIEDKVSDAREMGNEAMRGARDLRDTLADQVLQSIKTRPYTTLAIAGLIGFAYGALRRR